MAQTDAPPLDLDRLDLNEVKRFIVRRWKLIVAVAIACAILAGIVCLSLTPVYTATAQILLDPHKQHIFATDGAAPDGALDSAVIDSQIPIILSTGLLAKVVAKENLGADPEFSGTQKQGLLDKIFGLFRSRGVAKVETPSLAGIDPKLAPVIRALFGKVDVTRVAKSYVLQLSFSSRDPAKAMRLANSIAETYVEDQVSVHAKTVQQAATFFEDRLGDLRDQVRQSERAVSEFRKAHDLTTTTMDGDMTIGEQQLQNLNERLATSSSDTAEKVARYQQAMRFKANGTELDTLPEIIRSPVITQLRTQQADLARREADLSATYGAAYPAIGQIRAQRVGLDRAITDEMKRLVSTLRNDAEVAKAREDSLRKSIAGLTNTSGGDSEVGVKLRELERANQANQALFENFLKRAKLTQEQSTFEEPDARLISPALEPTAPASPKTKLIVPVAGIAGLLLGLGIAAAMDLVRKPDLGTPLARANAFILGRVPDIAGPRAGRVDCLDHLDENPVSPFADSIGRIAETLTLKARSGQGRVVVMTPLGSGEGATSLAICLAAAAGAAGRRVLIVDGDQDRRGLSLRLDALDGPGLGEVLAGDLTANEAVLAQPRFALLPAGRKPFDPVGAANKRLRGLLTEARHRFDLVIVDASAFETGPPAIGAMADDIVLVACWDQLLRENFVTAIDRMADRPNFAGVILNRTGAAEARDMALAG